MLRRFPASVRSGVVKTFRCATYTMRERREHKQFGRKQLLINAPITLIGFAAFGLMFLDFESRGVRFWIASSFFALAIISIATSEFVRFRRFRCPSCGDRLPKPNFMHLGVGDPICFICEKCNVEWDTGLSVPDGS